MIEVAFENSSYEHTHFLDLQTGEVLFVTGEARRHAESWDEENDSDAESDEGLADWEREEVKQAAQIEANPDRYVHIPRADSREGYRDMQDFIATVSDDRTAELLEVAIQGPGAFRRFKDVLGRFPAERKRYFKFIEERVRERIREWLHTLDVDPL